MAYRKTSNTPTILAVTDENASLAIRLMLEDIHRKSRPNTPKEHGQLRDNVLKQVKGTTGSIMWSKEYAMIQETKRFKNYTTSGTGPHFAENAVVDTVNNSSKYFRRVGYAG